VAALAVYRLAIARPGCGDGAFAASANARFAAHRGFEGA
jgi:hypothetical protein